MLCHQGYVDQAARYCKGQEGHLISISSVHGCCTTQANSAKDSDRVEKENVKRVVLSKVIEAAMFSEAMLGLLEL